MSFCKFNDGCDGAKRQIYRLREENEALRKALAKVIALSRLSRGGS